MNKSDYVDDVKVTTSTLQHDAGGTVDVLAGFKRFGCFSPSFRWTRSASKPLDGSSAAVSVLVEQVVRQASSDKAPGAVAARRAAKQSARKAVRRA